MAEVFSNRAESTLASGIAVGATSLSVTAGHGTRFPATGDFSILLQDASVATTYELVKCTARTTDTLTITATTLAWDAGDKVVHVVDKRVMDQLVSDIAGKQALSVIDAKGDLIVGTANDTTDNLTVGSNGQIVRAASGETTGLLWGALADGASVLTSETTTSTSFTDLATVGPSIAVTIGSSGKALVFISCHQNTDSASNTSVVSFSATGVAASDARATRLFSSTGAQSATWMGIVTGLTAGSNTFTLKYRVSAGTGTFNNRYIAVIPL